MRAYLALLFVIASVDARCKSLADQADVNKVCRQYRNVLPRPTVFDSCIKGTKHAQEKMQRAKCEGYCRRMPMPRPANENSCKVGCMAMTDMIKTCVADVAAQHAAEDAEYAEWERQEIIRAETSAVNAAQATKTATAAETAPVAAETTPVATEAAPVATEEAAPVAATEEAVPVATEAAAATPAVEPITLTVEGFGSATVQPDQEPADVVEAFAQGVVNAGRAFDLGSMKQLLDYFCSRRPCGRTALVPPSQPAAA